MSDRLASSTPGARRTATSDSRASRVRRPRWVPRPPTLFLMAVVGILIACWLEPASFRLPFVVQLFGVLPLAGGLWLTVAAERRFRRASTPVRHSQAPAALVTDGVFAWSRNPMYLGMTVALAGIALLAATPLGLLGTGFLAVVDVCFVRGEERVLEQIFGDAYREYRRSARRWI